MIVSLTKRQVAAVRHYATDRHLHYIAAARQRGKKVDIAMPYVGWAALFQAITDAAYHEWGAAKWTQVNKGPGLATFEARQRIVTRINEMDAHPAMQCQGVVGAAFERLVAFKHFADEAGTRVYPYPRLSGNARKDMVVLLPRHIDAPTLEHEGFSFVEPAGITVWEPYEPFGVNWTPVGTNEGLFLDPSEHEGW